MHFGAVGRPIHGIPAGVLGCVLAGVFALVLTFLQRRAGFRAALAAHWAADAVIFTGLYVVGVVWA